MAEYSVVVRFSDAAVASVNWDDQQHTGNATITDETTGNVYELGGSEPMLLKCTAVYDDDLDTLKITNTYDELYAAIESGKLPYMEYDFPYGSYTAKRQLMCTALTEPSQVTDNKYMVQFGAVRSGFIISFYSANSNSQMTATY